MFPRPPSSHLWSAVSVSSRGKRAGPFFKVRPGSRSPQVRVRLKGSSRKDGLSPSCSPILAVLPGITGLAQVKHKYDETIEDVKVKLSYDLAYVQNMSFATDMKIALWTLRTLTGRNAH